MYVEFFQLVPLALPIVVGLFGLVIGSFLNVVIYRLPIMMERDWRRQCEELASEPSTVPEQARHSPLRSLLSALGMSRVRRTSFGARQHSRAELRPATRPLSPLRHVDLNPLPHHRGYCSLDRDRRRHRARTDMADARDRVGVSWTLLALAIIDIDRFLLPDSLTLPLLWAGLVAERAMVRRRVAVRRSAL